MVERNGTDERGAARRQPKQSRGVETRNAILSAASRLFEDVGYEQTTTHTIAATAGVSVGALYRYFADKEAILQEVYGEETSRQRDRILSELDAVGLFGQDLRELVRSVLRLAFRVFSERPGLRRVLVEQSRKIPALAELRRSQDAALHDTVVAILDSVPGVRLPDRKVGAYLVRLFLESLIDERSMHRQKEDPLDDERVIEGATDFVLSYVLGR